MNLNHSIRDHDHCLHRTLTSSDGRRVRVVSQCSVCGVKWIETYVLERIEQVHRGGDKLPPQKPEPPKH